MIGRADATRLLQIAVERLQDNSAVLAGDQQFFEDLRASQVTKSKAWTDFYAVESLSRVAGRCRRKRALPLTRLFAQGTIVLESSSFRIDL